MRRTRDSKLVELEHALEAVGRDPWNVEAFEKVWEGGKYYAVGFLNKRGNVSDEVLGEIQTRLWETAASYDAERSGFGTWVRLQSHNVWYQHVQAANKFSDIVEAATAATAQITDNADTFDCYEVEADETLPYSHGLTKPRGRASADVLDYRTNVADAVVRRSVRQCLVEALDELPERRAEAVGAVYLLDMSYQEVATMMGISVKGVEHHVRAGLEDLRNAGLETLQDI